ncbi:MAG: hypothetical protein ACLRSW_12985 [Christensenellaceae bacterium]
MKLPRAWVEPDLILNWDEVENASKYKVDINGEQKDTRRTSYPLSSLKAALIRYV